MYEKMKYGLLILFLFSLSLFGETHITGDITEMTFESGGNPYIVEQDILIPEGNKVVIGEGCVFLFKPFTGLTVHGHLLVNGTQENPVVFTSQNDGEYNEGTEQLPNPFDWNGILVSRESGTVALKNFSLKFSVYGIKSQNTNIRIDNGIFRQNGQFHFTINDKIQLVQDNIAYSYNGTEEGDDKKVTKPPKPPKTEHKTSTTVKVIRYTSLGIGVLGTVFGIIYGVQTQEAYQDLMEYKNDINKYSTYKDSYLSKGRATIISSSIAVVGYAGFGISFLF